MPVHFQCPREEIIEYIVKKSADQLAELFGAYDTYVTLDMGRQELTIDMLKQSDYDEEKLSAVEGLKGIVIDRNPPGYEGWINVILTMSIPPGLQGLIKNIGEVGDVVYTLPSFVDLVREAFYMDPL